MKILPSTPIRKILFAILLAGAGLSALALTTAQSSGVKAASAVKTTQVNPNFTVKTIITADGSTIEEDIINGPPQPPAGYDLQRKAVTLPSPNLLGPNSVFSLDVPAYNWYFGCSATSASMIAAYYDRNGYPNIYTGPTNGGVVPLNNDIWGSWTDAFGGTYGQNPLTASRNGLDGRTTKGSIEDFWVRYGSSLWDPYINHWTVHNYGDAIGDYMKTSQSPDSNIDGATTFDNNPSNVPLTCDQMVGSGVSYNEGTVGRRAFYEARGYSVADCYNQHTDNVYAGGFSFAQYKAELDAGRPVLLNLDGHTIVGVGYDSSSNTVYLHDTWDYDMHSMTWGGSYSGMTLQSVSIVNPGPPALPQDYIKKFPNNGATGVPTNTNILSDWPTGAIKLEYCLTATPTTVGTACDIGWKIYPYPGQGQVFPLSNGTQYYWQTRASNPTGTTYADGGAWWSFTTDLVAPGAFTKTWPGPHATNIVTSPTLQWSTSIGASSYEYCITPTTSGPTCDTSWQDSSVPITSLNAYTKYYWQVRAVNSVGSTYADSGAWSDFTTGAAQPGAFTKTSPTNGATGISINPSLLWATSGGTGYQYCITATITTSGSTCDTGWTDISVPVATLENDIQYYWQARAYNNGGTTYADGDTWWSFTTSVLPPGAFNKTYPANKATGVPINLFLRGSESSGASSYDYCLTTSAPGELTACDTGWKALSNRVIGLHYNTLYYWQLRAINSGGTTYASDSPIWWHFTTIVAPPGAFGKTSPAIGAMGITTSPALSWTASSGASGGYEYCITTTITTSGIACDTSWKSAGTNLNVALTGLKKNTPYYWQVRAKNAGGPTYANGRAWWSFTTAIYIYLPLIMHY